MRTANAVLNFVIATGYIQFCAFIISDLKRRSQNRQTKALFAIFATCGLHHLVHGLCETSLMIYMGGMNPISPAPAEIYVLVAQTVFVFAWSYLRWEKLLGGRGDRHSKFMKYMPFVMIPYGLIVVTCSITDPNTVSLGSLLNIVIFVEYLQIAYRLARPKGMRSSLSGTLLSAYFANCALSHWVVAMAFISGRYAASLPMLIVDAASVVPGQIFLRKSK